jgi:hypothetical protein
MKRLRGMMVALLVTLGVSACCAPDTCHVAKYRFAELEPIVARLLEFHRGHGSFPATLEEAFPEGIPKGIVRSDELAGNYAFRKEKGGFTKFTYASLEESGMVSQAQFRDGSAVGHYALSFSYVGGGILSGMNDCAWATNVRDWRCRGYM